LVYLAPCELLVFNTSVKTKSATRNS